MNYWKHKCLQYLSRKVKEAVTYDPFYVASYVTFLKNLFRFNKSKQLTLFDAEQDYNLIDLLLLVYNWLNLNDT